MREMLCAHWEYVNPSVILGNAWTSVVSSMVIISSTEAYVIWRNICNNRYDHIIYIGRERSTGKYRLPNHKKLVLWLSAIIFNIASYILFICLPQYDILFLKSYFSVAAFTPTNILSYWKICEKFTRLTTLRAF